MSKKHSIRRTVAGILAVLTVTGNLIAPSQMRLPFAAENAIVAEAATIDNSSRWDNSGISWDSETGTLTIKDGITNVSDAVGKDYPDQITGNLYSGIFSKIDYEKVKNIVIANGASVPKSWYHLFENFTNLETFKVEEEVDASNVYDFGYAFAGLTKLREVDFSGLKNTSTVDYLENMFAGCTSLTSIDLSMLGGENVGLRTWGSQASGYHPAVDHIRRAVAGCDQLEELNLTGEFLYNLYENVNSKQSGTSISSILNQMLADNNSPNKQDILNELTARFNAYYNAVQDDMQWKPVAWHWKKDGDTYTCTVDVRKKVKKNKFETQYGLPCDVTTSVDPEPTCTSKGTKKFIAKWTNEEVTPNVTYTNTDEIKTIEIDALGHVYQVKDFEWSADCTSAEMVEECSRCLDVKRTPATVTHVDYPATCTEDAYTVYTAVCGDREDTQTIVHEGTALGHAWAEAWSWNGYTASLTLSCTNDGCEETVEPEVTVTSEITAEPTCEADGVRTYTATAEFDGETYTATKTEVLAATGHNYGEPVWNWDGFTGAAASFTCEQNDSTVQVEATITENRTEPTCTEAGQCIYTATVEFNGETYTDTKTEILAATGHNYGEPVWNWNGFTGATASFTCENEDSTVQVEATITENRTEPTCTEAGQCIYTATVEFDGETYTDSQTETLNALGHTPAEAVEENRVEATCTTDGSYDLVVYCETC
ncbi:MAG: hypothetical protein IKI77_06055, partial [Oscillospiraceae bacterium]|nr:hypothetical protein [Oscillospiraceae bacterium]